MYYYNYYKNQFKNRLRSKIHNIKIKESEVKDFLDLGIINPAIGTSNMGDFIIYEAVKGELKKRFPEALFTNYPSQLHTSYETKVLMSERDLLFVSGTNLLTSNMDSRNQWKLDPGHKKYLRNKVLLMGVGWWQYQDKPNRYTIDLYKSIFSDEFIHSVRDSYTCNRLQEFGIKNVVNTSCPTLWSLTPKKCSKIPKQKSLNVITTLTFYHANSHLDRCMIDLLVLKYEKVYLWVQGLDDIKYMKSIYPDFEKIQLVAPTLEAYDAILEDPLIEYVGTRLHAGVRALQKGKRTLILAVDNRASEIGRDTNLNVIKRENVEEILNFTDNSIEMNINLPIENINNWRESIQSI